MHAELIIKDIVNVIKELIENSFDSKADNINIYLYNYGLDIIEIYDNG